MKKSLPRFCVLAMSAALALFSGCEWTGGGGVEQWNDSYNFLNFSGVYRGINGGLLVTDYSSEVTQPVPVIPDTTNIVATSTNNISGETIAIGNGASTVFAGNVDHPPVQPGSLLISAGAFSFTDVDGDGTLEGTGGAIGNFTYGTGYFTLTLPAALDSGVHINASYNYTFLVGGEVIPGSPDTSTGSGPYGAATSGATKYAIYAFTVEHQGNILHITDNNGATYEGNLGDIRSAGGADQDNVQSNGGVVTPTAGDEFIAQFTAEGISKAGYKVSLVGTLQAIVVSTTAAAAGGTGTATTLRSVVLDQRRMFGTWIEEGGRTGNITGETSPVTVNL